MYHGEVNVQYDEISHFLRTARLLQIRGLTGDNSNTLGHSISGKDYYKKEKKESVISNPSVEENKSLSPPPKRRKPNDHENISENKQSPEPSVVADVRNSSKDDLKYYENAPFQISSSRPTSPEVSQPTSLPSNIISIPSIASSHHPPFIPSMTNTSPFPHLMGAHFAQQYQGIQDDASDTCVSDRSDDHDHTSERDVNEGDEHSIEDYEKISGFANIAALKGMENEIIL